MSALVHALYTNAADSGGRGFQLRIVGATWGEAERRRLAGWLRALVPPTPTATSEAGAPIAAVQALRLDGALYACLAGVDTTFGRDDFGRAAVLAHAVATPLDERRPADDWGRALLDAQRRVAADGSSALEAYVGRCVTMAGRAAVPITLTDWAAVAPTTVVALWSMAAARAALTPAQAAAGPPPRIELPAVADPVATLLAATGLLPPRLRLAFRWTIGPVDVPGTISVVLGTGADRAPAPADPRAHAYARWLTDTRRPAGHRVSLATDWRIRSWDELMNALTAEGKA